MKSAAYSSLAAFVAHYRALKSSPDLAAHEQAILAEMEKLVDSIGAEVRLVLDSNLGGKEPGGAGGRRRERAERRLQRELLARGTLTG